MAENWIQSMNRCTCPASWDRPPCTVCGKPFAEHGSYPTCASHAYTPDGHAIGTTTGSKDFLFPAAADQRFTAYEESYGTEIRTPPRLRDPGESVGAYRVAMGWPVTPEQGREAVDEARRNAGVTNLDIGNLIADLEHRAKWWRQRRRERVSVDNLAGEGFASELDRAVAALRAYGAQEGRNA